MQWLCAKKKGKSDKIYKRPLEIELDKYPLFHDFCLFLAHRYSVIFKCISVFDQFFSFFETFGSKITRKTCTPLLGMGLWAIIVYAKNVLFFCVGVRT